MTFDILFSTLAQMGSIYLSLHWLIIAITAVLMVIAVVTSMDNKPTESAIVATIAGAILFQFGVFSPVVPEGFVFSQDYLQLATLALYYVIAGLFWSMVRWAIFLIGRRMEGSNRPPLASDHKGKIGAWAIYWPLSILIYIVKFVFKDIFKVIWYPFRWVYQGIVDLVYANAK